MSSMDDDINQGILLVLACAGLTLLLISVFVALPVIAVGFGGWLFYRWRIKSPAALERRERDLIHQLYRDAKRITPHTLTKAEFGKRVAQGLPDLPATLEMTLVAAAYELYDAEQFGESIPPPPMVCNSLEGARYKDFLSAHTAKIGSTASTTDALNTIVTAFNQFLCHVPSLPPDAGAVTCTVPLVSYVDDVGQAVEDMVALFFAPETEGLFEDLCMRLEQNVHDVSDIPFTRENRYHPKLISPSDYTGEDLPYAYLKGTPLLDVLNAQIPFSFPKDAWYEHAWCLAPPGTGKTQLVQFLVSERLPEVERGDCSVVVMDSQVDLIRQLRSLKCFAPGEPLHDKLIIIEPDLDYPPALNIFDFGRDRIKAYSSNDREKFTNIAITQMTYVLDALMGEGGAMTTKQETLYRYIVRLLMEVPDATLATLSDILQITKSAELARYQPYIDRLHQPAQDFFREQFLDSEFAGTKRQVAWRVSNLRENTYFDRMFSHPRSKLDLFTELNSSMVILVNTDKEQLGEDGTNVFGRYFIGALLTASQERASLPHGGRLPVHCFIDECQDYIATDAKVASLLDQARKMRISMFLAHQRSKQIKNSNVFDALSATAIKFASTDNPNDADLAAKALHTTREFVGSQPSQYFAIYVRRQTPSALSVRVPFFVVEEMEKMTEEDQEAVRRVMRERYATVFGKDSDRRADMPAHATERPSGHSPDAPVGDLDNPDW